MMSSSQFQHTAWLCRKGTMSRNVKLIKSVTKTGTSKLRIASDCVDCDGGKSRFISYSLIEKLDPESRRHINDAESDRSIESKGDMLSTLATLANIVTKDKGIEPTDVPNGGSLPPALVIAANVATGKGIEAATREDIPKMIEEVKKKEKQTIVEKIQKYLDALIAHGFEVSCPGAPDSSDSDAD
jgi:hypothetical protein